MGRSSRWRPSPRNRPVRRKHRYREDAHVRQRSGPDRSSHEARRVRRHPRRAGGALRTQLRVPRRRPPESRAVPRGRGGRARPLLRRDHDPQQPRDVAVPHGQHEAAVGGEDGALPPSRFRDRLLQGQRALLPSRSARPVPAHRADRLAHDPHRGVQRPADDLLAGQLGEPQGRAQRELRPGGAGAVLDGHRELHRGRREGVRPRVHRVDVHAADPALPLRPLRSGVRVRRGGP